MVGLSWERLAADYNVLEGGLMPFELLVLLPGPRSIDGLPEFPHEEYCDTMKRQLPSTYEEWLQEIRLAIADAEEAKPFAALTGQRIIDADLFHLAPLVALKF